MGAQDLTGRSTATIHCTATKGRTRHAHFLWQPRCSCFLTLYALSNVQSSLCCFQRHDHALVFSLFLTFFLPSVPPRWSIFLSYFRSLCFYPGWLLLPTIFYTSHLFTFSKDLCFSTASLLLLSLSPFVLFQLCIRWSFSTRHKNNRLLFTTVSFLSNFLARILLQN